MTSTERYELAQVNDDALVVNMSTWSSLETLSDFAFGSFHVEVMRPRREWFSRMSDPYTVLWWVPAGHRPTVAEAQERLELLAALGPVPQAFTFRRPFAPDGSSFAPERGPRLCEV